MSFSGGSSRPRGWIHVSCISCIGRPVLYHSCHLGSPLCSVNPLNLTQIEVCARHWKLWDAAVSASKLWSPYFSVDTPPIVSEGWQSHVSTKGWVLVLLSVHILNIHNAYFPFCAGGTSHSVAYRILAPWPGIRPVPPAVEAQHPNPWTTREGPPFFLRWSV